MTRTELYNEIKCLNLQEEIKNVTGRNYTQVPNSTLEEIISKATIQLMEQPKKVKKTSTKCEKSLEKLVNILAKKHILLPSEVREIFN